MAHTINFPFPYKPYDVQQQLMTAIFQLLEAPQRCIDAKCSCLSKDCYSSSSQPTIAHVGIFESPTGTGKTLSTIISILHWYFDYYLNKQAKFPPNASALQTATSSNTSADPDWLVEFMSTSIRDEHIQAEIGLQKYFQQTARTLQLPNFASRTSIANKRKLETLASESVADPHTEKIVLQESESHPLQGNQDLNDEDLLLEWKEDASVEANSAPSASDWRSLLSKSSSKDTLMKDDIFGQIQSATNTGSGNPRIPHIFFCSRTHSQLMQFTDELKKSTFSNRTRCTSLGGRNQLCIHNGVRALQSVNQMNEVCLEMQKHKTKPTSVSSISDQVSSQLPSKRGRSEVLRKQHHNNTAIDVNSSCPYLATASQSIFIKASFKDAHDIEELHQLGEKYSICPYYGTRASIPYAHIITMPYSLLLHEPARISLGLSEPEMTKYRGLLQSTDLEADTISPLHNSIVVIDEAHNLMETITELHSAKISFSALQVVQGALAAYTERYTFRLNSQNLLMCKQLLFLLDAFLNCITSRSMLAYNGNISKPNRKSSASNKIEHYSYEIVLKFITQSNIGKKLNGFYDRHMKLETFNGSSYNNSIPNCLNILGTVDSFLGLLNYTNSDGRVSIETTVLAPSPSHGEQPATDAKTKPQIHPSSSIRYLLLNPSLPLKALLSQVRVLLLLGGTMQPFSFFTNNLFSELPKSHLHYQSCSHVVSSENICALTLSSGPTGIPFQFTHANRNSNEQFEELGRTVVNFSKVIPGGMILFFSSYSIENQIMELWNENGTITKISQKKVLFRESNKAHDLEMKGDSTKEESVFLQYKAVIDQVEARKSGKSSGVNTNLPSNITGALLTCIVGGRLSEGINFSDALARAVIMVGMPYPNMMSPKLQETMAYFDRASNTKSNSQLPSTPNPPQQSISPSPTFSSTKTPGMIYYEYLCMRAINQCIGRSIRHINDYAAIILCDQRYETPSVQQQLPTWISNSMRNFGGNNTAGHGGFGSSYALLQRFFSEK